jgi:hydrogenase expression/formation protein HypC
MCLGIPAKIISLHGDYAVASINGASINIGIQLVENLNAGDYVLIHTGYALEKIDEEEALATIKMIKESTAGLPGTSDLQT